MKHSTRPSNSVRRLSFHACVLALATACADSATGLRMFEPTGTVFGVQNVSGTADINGVWPFHEDATLLLYDFVGHATKVFQCSSDGTYAFVQTGTTFTGMYDQVGVCTAADGTTFPNNVTGGTVSGTIQVRHLRYTSADGCSFDEAVRGATINEMGGSVRCGRGGDFGIYRGSWSATR